ncbi:MAG: lamin tail domain-containing protein, partial [bacterium]
MTISKYLKYYILIILFFSCFSLARAGFEVSEVMYDASGTDDGHEWVEVENTGSLSDDLSKWYLFTDNSKHALVPQGQAVVPAYGYAVIAQNPAKFKSDYPNFSGILYDSSWTDFNNTNETIGLKDPVLTLADSMTVNSSMGATGDGNSLQKIDGVFIGSIPTPGLANVKSTPIVVAEPLVAESVPIKTLKKSKFTKSS